MCDEKKNLYEGYQPQKKGYQPSQGKLDQSKPPKSGTGVPAKSQSDQGQLSDQN